MKTPIALPLLAFLLSGYGNSEAQISTPQCDDFRSLRRPFFGDLHVHTAYSWDAVVFGTTNEPHHAYSFARGEEIPQPPAAPDEPQPKLKLRRPLHFAAVTDHSEGFGLVGVCSNVGGPGYDSPECKVLRGETSLPSQFKFILAGASANNPVSPAVCLEPGVDCDQAAPDSVWAKIREAANDPNANKPCEFTTFVAYEWTEQQFDAHLHRNVIFRNDKVLERPVSAIDTHGATTGIGGAQRLWALLRERCLENEDVQGCDVLTIPHNSNISRGQTFVDPKDATEARERQVFEPLVEIMQHKGASECRFDARFGRGVDTADELCAFEQLPQISEFLPPQPVVQATGVPPEAFSARAFVRNVLKDGLALEQRGFVDPENPLELAHVNPFKLGLIGSTDTHSATSGATDEKGWTGHQGSQDGKPELRLGASISRNPGGLAVVWAEENTRDSIFEALRRRETYGTSGTRPTVRFFGGWSFDDGLCSSPELESTGYQSGVAMGGDLPAAPAEASAPKFITWAMQDPGTNDFPGNTLQRIQIVKGWADGSGQTHEKVFDVAPENPSASREVDPGTCRAKTPGSPEICRVWTDPEFKPTEPAFYYARILEDPSCRWAVYDCIALGVDPFASNCDTTENNPYPECCASNTDPVTQERAWTSPIWYRPPYS